MGVYLVTYDLRQPGRNYEPLYQELRSYTHCHELESVWLIDTTQRASAIREGLRAKIDANDALFVAELREHWASRNYDCADWLKDESRRWS